MDTRLAVCLWCLGGIFVLSLFYWMYDSVIMGIFAGSNYSIKLAGNITYERDNATFVIGANRDTINRSLSIYGINDGSNWRIFSSFAGGESENDVKADAVLFDSNPILIFRVTDVPKVIMVAVQNLERGMYHGWFYISSDKSNIAIPVSISTDPKLVQAVTLITVGVVSSIALWEVVFYIYVVLKKEKAGKQKRKVSDILNPYVPYAMTTSNILSLEKVDMNILGVPTTKMGTVDSLKNSAYKKEQAARRTEKRYSTDMGKIFTIDGATIGFGILTAMFGLLNNSYVTNLVLITTVDAAILIGIGLGIGSLKGLVDKPKSPEEDGAS